MTCSSFVLSPHPLALSFLQLFIFLVYSKGFNISLLVLPVACTPSCLLHWVFLDLMWLKSTQRKTYCICSLLLFEWLKKHHTVWDYAIIKPESTHSWSQPFSYLWPGHHLSLHNSFYKTSPAFPILNFHTNAMWMDLFLSSHRKWAIIPEHSKCWYELHCCNWIYLVMIFCLRYNKCSNLSQSIPWSLFLSAACFPSPMFTLPPCSSGYQVQCHREENPVGTPLSCQQPGNKTIAGWHCLKLLAPACSALAYPILLRMVSLFLLLAPKV